MAKTTALEKAPASVTATAKSLYRLDMSSYGQTELLFDAKKREWSCAGELQTGDALFRLLFNDKIRKDSGGGDPQNHVSMGTNFQAVETDDVALTKTSKGRLGIELIIHYPQSRIVTPTELRKAIDIAYCRTYVGSGTTLTERVLTDLLYGRIDGLYRA